jgi:hypothetical protein
MRKFDEASKAKKALRIQVPANPDRLSGELLAALEAEIKASLRDGHLPCPAAWKISREAGVSRLAAGEIADRLGIRVSGCQIGFFKKNKTPYTEPAGKLVDDEVAAVLEQLSKSKQLTCAGIFEIAQRFKLKPLDVSHAASARGLVIRECQLGCF